MIIAIYHYNWKEWRSVSCSNPMLAYQTNKVNPESGKRAWKFLGALKRFTDLDDQLSKYGTIQIFDDLGDYLVNPETGEALNRARILPCGQCLQCRVKRAASWADRIMLEASYYGDQVYFLTLTYDDQHVPVSSSVDGAPTLTLEPKHLQDFVKRFRRQQEYHHGNKIKYYAVGEYGSQYHRPHYHMIVFGAILEDIEEMYRNRQGRLIHDSSTIRKLWDNGITEVERMSWELAAYAARYCVKKLGKAESDYYESMGIVPEYQRCSLGFAKQYYEDNCDEIYKYDQIHISTAAGGRTVKPPKYFDRMYDDVYPSSMAEVKGNREQAARLGVIAKMQRTNLSYLELLELDDNTFKARTRTLRRELEL